MKKEDQVPPPVQPSKKPLLKNPYPIKKIAKAKKESKIKTFYKKWKLSIISFFILFLAGSIFMSGFFIAEKTLTIETVSLINVNINISGMEVNKYIIDDLNYFITKYAIKENIDKKKAKLLITLSLKYEVPINTTFSIAYNESRYKEKAISKLNKNGSYDYGIMQLNSYSFPDVKKLLPIDKNITNGLSYLKECYVKSGSWDLAYIEYGCGAIKNFDRVDKEHLAKAIAKTKELDAWVSLIISNKIIQNSN